MKKIIFTILLLFPLIVLAESPVSVSKFKEIAISGDITNQFKENHKKNNTTVEFTLEDNGDTFNINVTFTSKGKTDADPDIIDNYSMRFYINNQYNTLESTYDYDEPANYNKLTDEEKLHIERAKEIYKLIPLWGLESSDDYKRIKTYREAGDDYINFLSPIFEVCYLSEKGACYVESTHNKIITLKGEVEISDKPIKYALKVLEENSRDKSLHKTYLYCIIIIAILGPIFLIKLKQKDQEDLQAKHHKLYDNKFIK